MKKAKLPKKEDSKEKKPSKQAFLLSSKCFFLTYKGISDSGQKVTKSDLKNYLVKQNLNDRKLRPEKYLICEQTYQDGAPHFHVILLYQKRKHIQNSAFFDYQGIHPNIQTMRNMKAALEYVYKQDSAPLTNMDLIQQKRVARAKDSSSLYQLLEQQMMKDPFNFNVFKYCLDHHITRQVYKTNYTKAVNLLKQVQQAYCNKLLHNKPGFKFIDRHLIQSILSPQQLLTFDSWSGYQTIINYLNQIVLHKGDRDPKTKNLLLTGAPNCGKSALVWHPKPHSHFNPLSKYCSIYPMGMSQWFPKYQSYVYDCIYWNEAKLTSYSYDTILKLLDGSPLDLNTKGSVSRKVDNPLIVMTSNMTLDQMITQKFHYSKSLQDMAHKNLAVRVQNVIVPEGYDLFLLQKLLIFR